jgi:predicted O-methyltransferase YrrM
MRVFEFGSGNSTLWFSTRVESIVSIENDIDFYLRMLNKFKSIDNVLYELGKLNDNYNQKVLAYENEFDIVIIDGRERVQCVKNSIKALKKDGIIIFDNSDRIEYEEAYYFLTEHKFKKIDFRGIGAIGHTEWQTTIYYRDYNCFEI